MAAPLARVGVQAEAGRRIMAGKRQARRVDARIPFSSDDVEPRPLRRHLRFVGTVEPTSPGDDVRGCLTGTAFTELLGREGRDRALRGLPVSTDSRKMLSRRGRPS